MTEPKRPSVDELIDRVMSAMPADVQQAREDLEQQLRQAMKSAFSRLDLVTREEFDVQAALLARTRERLEQMMERLDELEARHGDEKRDEQDS